MTTCPRCGRIADDEFVCAGCGAFLAGDDAGPAAAVSVGRVAVLVFIVCLLGAGGAALLLRSGGGGHDASIPPVSSPVELSEVPLGSPVTSPAAAGSTTARPTTSVSATRTGTPSPTAHRSTSAAPSPTRTSATRSASTSAHPSTSHSTTRPPSSPPPSTPPLTVQLAEGGAASGCGPHCYALVVSLSGGGGGAHDVTCHAGHVGVIGRYTTSAATSTGCSYNHPHDSVWVVVDGRRSNTVSW